MFFGVGRELTGPRVARKRWRGRAEKRLGRDLSWPTFEVQLDSRPEWAGRRDARPEIL